MDNDDNGSARFYTGYRSVSRWNRAAWSLLLLAMSVISVLAMRASRSSLDHTGTILSNDYTYENVPTTDTAIANTTPASTWTKLRGINWADARDNFVDGWIIPSGIDPNRTLKKVGRQADQILSEFQRLLFDGDDNGTNTIATSSSSSSPHDHGFTIRFGINPATVFDYDYWLKYKYIIDWAVNIRGLNVILACWEGASDRNGRIDDYVNFWAMWDKVVKEFADVDRVLLEIFNEPHGYTDEEWRTLAAQWVDRYTNRTDDRNKSIPILSDRHRILVTGTGYSENVTTIAEDKRFDGCRLSFHLYAWFGGHTKVESWKEELGRRIGRENAPRTIVSEWGAPMKIRPNDYYCSSSSSYHLNNGTQQLDYANDDDGDKDGREKAYIIAMSEVIRDWNMGSIYWPGLRDGDVYSLTERKNASAPATYSTRQLFITNPSGRDRLQWSFGLHHSSTESSTGIQKKKNDQASEICVL